MTTVDFHFNTADRLQHACRLVRKAVRAGAVSEDKPMVILLGSAEELEAFDELLYSFSEEDFLPHMTADHPMAAEAPIVLCVGSYTPEPPRVPNLLLNLSPEVPEVFSRYNRVFEVVGPQEDDKQAARQRYAFYRDRGYTITRHDLGHAS